MARRGHKDGSIYQRADGRWAATISLENGKRLTFYGKTRKEVQEKLKTALYEQQKGILATGPQQKVEHFLTHWLEKVHRHTIRIRTYERYEEIIRLHLIPGIGYHKLQKFTPQQLQAFYTQKLEEGFSPSTVTSFHNVLHKALDTAVRWSLISRNVCELVTPPRKKRYEIQPLNIEQIRRFMETIRGHHSEALFILALSTGMRRGEILGLKWQDIDFQTGVLQVRRILTRIPTKLPGKGYIETEPKTDKGRRSIVLPAFALEILKQHRLKQWEMRLKAGALWQDHGYVFCTSIGTYLNPTRDVLNQLKIHLTNAGLPNIRFHDLRHSSATMLLSMEVHPKIVQEILGHSQISMTMDIYSHVLPTMQKEVMSRLNDVLQG